MLTSLLLAAWAASRVDEPIRLGDRLCHPRRLIAKFASAGDLKRSIPKGGKVLAWYPQISVAVVETPKGALQASRKWMAERTRAQWVDFDRVALPAYEPNDPMWPDMWHMRAIKADLAWDHSFGSDAVTVAVIDTGVDLTHEDLSANAWVNGGEIPGNGIDDDLNGYIDDIIGYDFAYGDPDPDDVHGHGTACAGLVAAVQDNSLGVTGVAPRAKVMALKAATDAGYFYDSANIAAYLYAADNGANVLSMSYFSDRVSRAEGDAIRYCRQNGVLPVAAAGNSSSVYPYYPAAYDDVLSVAALNTSLRKAGFSNHGYWVDVAAPGTSLWTTTAGGGYTSGFGGTSGACPHVAGLAALLLGAKHGSTAGEVRAAIEDTAIPVNQGSYGVYCNYGIIDAEAAMLSILGPPAPPRPPEVRVVSGLGSQIADFHYDTDAVMTFRLHGRGLDRATTASVRIGGVELPIANRQRDWITAVYLPPITGPLKLFLDGQEAYSLTMPNTFTMAHPLLAASTPEGGAACWGGFAEALLEDSQYVRVTRRDDGRIVLHGVFRQVQFAARMDLLVRRHFTGTSEGTETIQLYDWSSASYPYGNFVTIHSGPVPTGPTTSTFNLTDPIRFMDPERTIYFRILTSDDLSEGAELRLDVARIALK